MPTNVNTFYAYFLYFMQKSLVQPLLFLAKLCDKFYQKYRRLVPIFNFYRSLIAFYGNSSYNHIVIVVTICRTSKSAKFFSQKATPEIRGSFLFCKKTTTLTKFSGSGQKSEILANFRSSAQSCQNTANPLPDKISSAQYHLLPCRSPLRRNYPNRGQHHRQNVRKAIAPIHP